MVDSADPCLVEAMKIEHHPLCWKTEHHLGLAIAPVEQVEQVDPDAIAGLEGRNNPVGLEVVAAPKGLAVLVVAVVPKVLVPVVVADPMELDLEGHSKGLAGLVVAVDPMGPAGLVALEGPMHHH